MPMALQPRELDILVEDSLAILEVVFGDDAAADATCSGGMPELSRPSVKPTCSLLNGISVVCNCEHTRQSG
jgi:hypothetical protein